MSTKIVLAAAFLWVVGAMPISYSHLVALCLGILIGAVVVDLVGVLCGMEEMGRRD